MEHLVSDPVKVGVCTVAVGVLSAVVLGVVHLVTLAVVGVGGLLTLRAALKK